MITLHSLAKARGLFANTRGAALVEFALVAPVLILLYLGTVEATSAVRAYMKLNAVAQTYANLIANQPNITRSSLANYCGGSTLVLWPLDTAGLSIAAASVTNKAGAPTQDWHDTTQCGTGISSIAGVTLAGCPGANCLIPNTNDSAIVVRARYAYSSFLHYVLPATQIFSQSTSARPRQNATVPCSDCTQN